MNYYNMDSLDFLKTLDDLSVDINFSDPPYALGSKIIIKPDGKPDYKKAVDFMSRWKMPSGEYWEEWFKEAYRSLKHGGYCIMYGIDRQTFMFKYYAHLSGFEERQSMYWYFISSFPKSSDLSKNLDDYFGEEITNGEMDDNIAISDLAKKYDGYKYSIAPLKQTCEDIMVFQKPYKTGSCLHDTIAYENGDSNCCCGALNIGDNKIEYDFFEQHNDDSYKDDGRYPTQLYVDIHMNRILQEQNNSSRILDVADYTKHEHDLCIYHPKVSTIERGAGLEEFEKKDGAGVYDFRNTGHLDGVVTKARENSHPTMKPIELNYKILKLFKTPNEQVIIYPFAGTGSEIIGGEKAGFTTWFASELDDEWKPIAEARIKHWRSIDYDLSNTPRNEETALDSM